MDNWLWCFFISRTILIFGWRTGIRPSCSTSGYRRKKPAMLAAQERRQMKITWSTFLFKNICFDNEERKRYCISYATVLKISRNTVAKNSNKIHHIFVLHNQFDQCKIDNGHVDRWIPDAARVSLSLFCILVGFGQFYGEKTIIIIR